MAPPVEEVIDEFSLFMAFSGGVAILEKYA